MQTFDLGLSPKLRIGGVGTGGHIFADCEFAPPQPPEPEPPASVPIPGLAAWAGGMVPGAKKFAAPDVLTGTYEGQMWYGDGRRVLGQIQAYTGEDLSAEIAQCEKVYQAGYLRRAGCSGRRVFPHGIEMAWNETSYLRYAADMLTLINRADYARSWPALWERTDTGGTLVSFHKARPAAFLMQAFLAAARMDIPNIDGLQEYCDQVNAEAIATKDLPKSDPAKVLYVGNAHMGGGASNSPITPLPDRIDSLLRLLLGHFSQWFDSRTATYMQPFMVAFAADALIEYAQQHGISVRMMDSITKAANFLKNHAWNEEKGCFWYMNDRPYEDWEDREGLIYYPVLNMLIAPMYAWLFAQTGDVKWRDFGDKVFKTGAEYEPWSGKEFTYKYRLSFKYVELRQES